MALIIPNVGEIELLTKMLKTALSVDDKYILRLFKTDLTLSATTVAADLNAEEADFTNYVEVTLVRASWGTPTTVSNVASSTYATVASWTCGASGNTIHGYYVLGEGSGILLWAEEFSSPRTLTSGDILNLTPIFTFSSAI
jgi:hypothetical protein